MIRKHTMTTQSLKQFPFYARKHTTDHPIASDVIETDCYRTEEIGVVDPLVFDIGANAGAFSLLAFSKWPGASVVAYEPHPLNFGMLMYNLRDQEAYCSMSAMYGGSLPQAWLVERPQHEDSEFGGWGLCQYPGQYRPDFRNEVGVKCDLSDAETEFQLYLERGRDTVVKMDCEGCEFSIVEGLSDDSMRAISVITGEIHTNAFLMDYFPYRWSPFREKILEYFDCPEIEERKTTDGELFNFLAVKK